jgi:hypothetical protein
MSKKAQVDRLEASALGTGTLAGVCLQGSTPQGSLRLSRSDDALNHDDEQHLALIPSADPAHPPAIDAIAQSCCFAQAKEPGLNLEFLKASPACAKLKRTTNTRATGLQRTLLKTISHKFHYEDVPLRYDPKTGYV